MIASMIARVSASSTPSPLSPRSPAISPIPNPFDGGNSRIERRRRARRNTALLAHRQAEVASGGARRRAVLDEGVQLWDQRGNDVDSTGDHAALRNHLIGNCLQLLRRSLYQDHLHGLVVHHVHVE